MFPTPRLIPIALGTNSHDCAKGYVLFAERIGLLELLRPLPTKPATGKYPGCVWVVLAQLISSGKKNGQSHSLRTGKFSMLAQPFFGWGMEESFLPSIFFFFPTGRLQQREQCDDNLSHVILFYSDFVAASCAQKGLVRDHSLETAVGIIETQKAPKPNADTINE